MATPMLAVLVLVAAQAQTPDAPPPAPPPTPAPTSATPTPTTAAPTPAPTPATPAATDGSISVLVLDLKAVGVTEGEAGLLRDAIVARLGRFERLKVISAGEVKTLVDVEAEKAATGCDVGAGGACLAEIAGALGAEYVVAGSVGKLGESTVVNLSLIDAKGGASVKSRAQVTAPSLDDALVAVGPEVDKLAAPLVGASVSPVVVGGGVVAGVGAVVGLIGAVWVTSLELTVDARDGGGQGKQEALDNRGYAFAALGGGVVVAAAGGALVAVGMME